MSSVIWHIIARVGLHVENCQNSNSTRCQRFVKENSIQLKSSKVCVKMRGNKFSMPPLSKSLLSVLDSSKGGANLFSSSFLKKTGKLRFMVNFGRVQRDKG